MAEAVETVEKHVEKTKDDYEVEALAARFEAHKPTKGEFTDLGKLSLFFSTQLLNLVPDCRERSEAIKKLEECIMWAQLGIDRNK